MMPHPERAADLKSRDGMKIWNALLRQVREKHEMDFRYSDVNS